MRNSTIELQAATDRMAQAKVIEYLNQGLNEPEREREGTIITVLSLVSF
jgi:hypothetical protein